VDTMNRKNTEDLWTYGDRESWSNTDITGFSVEATDGSIGSIDEATYEAGASYIVVDTGPWIFGRKVMLPAGVIQSVDVEDERVWLNRTKSEIENAPEFDEAHHNDDTYRSEVGTYYGGDTSPDRHHAEHGDTDNAVLERSEERLTVDKQREQSGSVRVGKHVVEEEQSVDVPVTREEVHMERRSVDRPASGDAIREDSVDVPVYEERVETGKEARVVEELEVGKTAETDTKRVSDSVRREEFDVEKDDTTRR
jgi:uncharacterized protein (TIGR02271 family)